MICAMRSRWTSGLRGASEHGLVVERVVPDALAPRIVTDVTIFLHAAQNILHLGTADDG